MFVIVNTLIRPYTYDFTTMLYTLFMLQLQLHVNMEHIICLKLWPHNNGNDYMDISLRIIII